MGLRPGFCPGHLSTFALVLVHRVIVMNMFVLGPHISSKSTLLCYNMQTFGEELHISLMIRCSQTSRFIVDLVIAAFLNCSYVQCTLYIHY